MYTKWIFPFFLFYLILYSVRLLTNLLLAVVQFSSSTITTPEAHKRIVYYNAQFHLSAAGSSVGGNSSEGGTIRSHNVHHCGDQSGLVAGAEV